MLHVRHAHPHGLGVQGHPLHVHWGRLPDEWGHKPHVRPRQHNVRVLRADVLLVLDDQAAHLLHAEARPQHVEPHALVGDGGGHDARKGAGQVAEADRLCGLPHARLRKRFQVMLVVDVVLGGGAGDARPKQQVVVRAQLDARLLLDVRAVFQLRHDDGVNEDVDCAHLLKRLQQVFPDALHRESSRAVDAVEASGDPDGLLFAGDPAIERCVRRGGSAAPVRSGRLRGPCEKVYGVCSIGRIFRHRHRLRLLRDFAGCGRSGFFRGGRRLGR